MKTVLLALLKSFVTQLLGELPDWSDPEAVKAWIMKIMPVLVASATTVQSLVKKLTGSTVRLSIDTPPCADPVASTALLACAEACDTLQAQTTLRPEVWNTVLQFLKFALPLVLQLVTK